MIALIAASRRSLPANERPWTIPGERTERG